MNTKWILKTQSELSDKAAYPIQRKMIVGRGNDANIILHKNEISRKHAELEVKGYALFVKDLNSVNGTFVNGLKILGEQELQSGDVLKFEDISFDVVRVDDEEAEKTGVNDPLVEDHTLVQGNLSMAQPAKTSIQEAIRSSTRLVVVRGGEVGRVFQLDGIRAIKIGRSSKCDIVLEDPTVSGEHAEILNTQEGWRVNNLSQTNGLFINGNKVLRHFLKNRDSVELGSTVLRFETEDGGEGGKDNNAKIPDWMRHQV